MINFTREGTKVRIGVTSSVPHYHTREFYVHWECNSEIFAGLLAERFKTTLLDTMKAVREEAYNQGWKDAKAKKQKETWFSGRLP